MDVLKLEINCDPTLASSVVTIDAYKRVAGVGFAYDSNYSYSDATDLNTNFDTDLDTAFPDNAV